MWVTAHLARDPCVCESLFVTKFARVQEIHAKRFGGEEKSGNFILV